MCVCMMNFFSIISFLFFQTNTYQPIMDMYVKITRESSAVTYSVGSTDYEKTYKYEH